MATTLLSDIIVPEIYLPYFRQETTRLDAFIQAGVTATPPNFEFPTMGGDTVQMPYFTPMDGESEIDSDTVDATYGKRTTGKMQARMHLRRKGWQRSDLSAALAGADPHGAIVAEDAKFWVGERQKIMFASLDGFFRSAGAANTFDISAATGAAANIDGSATMDAGQRMGDAKGKLTAMAVHSATENSLAKQGLIEYVQEADESPRVPFYQGKRVVVDDSLPVASDVYTSYLFGAGALAYETGVPTGFIESETDRNIDRGIEKWLRRAAFFLHINGANFTSDTVAAAAPTNAELALAANWTLWEDPKNVRIVQFKHKIG